MRPTAPIQPAGIERMGVRLFKVLVFLIAVLAGADFTYEKPRRVFTRGFVMFCIAVAVFELLLLNNLYQR